MSSVTLHRATSEDRAALDRLWLMFRHDLSEYQQVLPRPDGTFRDERLTASLEDPDRAAWLLQRGNRPVGLALGRQLDTEPRVLSSFFIVRGARRQGLGRQSVRAVVSAHPGAWEVAYQAANGPASLFWPQVAAELDPIGWARQDRPVPGRPDLPPDTWVSFQLPREHPDAGRTPQPR